MHPAALAPDRLLAECDEQRTRRSGPGGQHRNKVETAVVLHHRPSGISAEASERRSQSENREMALFRLRLRLALEIRLPVSSPYAPSLLWQARCREGKISVNSQHQDFPTILAEGLDVLVACGFDPAAAARELNCTASQLIKLLQKEPQFLARVNRERQRLGMHLLK
jgi:RF-1 domain